MESKAYAEGISAGEFCYNLASQNAQAIKPKKLAKIAYYLG